MITDVDIVSEGAINSDYRYRFAQPRQQHFRYRDDRSVTIPNLIKINSARTRCIVKTSGFTRVVCKKSGILLNFKVF